MRNHYGEGEIELELIDMLASEIASHCLFESGSTARAASRDPARERHRVQGDRIVEISIFEADQYAVDELVHGAQ